MSDTPKIYVACLASYNAGNLHGKWIDCDVDYCDIEEEIRLMLGESPIPNAEEYAIHDYEGWGDLKLDEHENIEVLSETAQLLEEHGEIFGAVVSHVGGVEYLKDATTLMEECYQGSYDNLADWAEQFLDDTGALIELQGNLKFYFDYEKYADDCEMGGDIFSIEHNGDVHVFWNQ